MVALPIGALPGGTIFRNVGVAGRPAMVIGAGKLLHVLSTSIPPAEFPPARKANAPFEENATAFAGAVNGYFCKACSAEYTYNVLPPSPRMKAFELSGEKVAVVALLMFRGADPEAVPELLTT